MLLGTRQLRWVITAGIVLAFVGTHWLCYRWGVNNERQRLGNLGLEVINSSRVEALTAQLVIARLLLINPQAMPPKEKLTCCVRLKGLADDVQGFVIARLRSLGNDAKADRLQKDVEEARGLVTKICPNFPREQ